MNSVAKNQKTLKKFSVEITVCFDNIEVETPEEAIEQMKKHVFNTNVRVTDFNSVATEMMW